MVETAKHSGLTPEYFHPHSSTQVVVTGMGTLNPLGNNLEEYWSKLVAGKSGINRIKRFDPGAYPTQIAGEVKDFEPRDYLGIKEARRMSRASQFAVVAAG